MLARYAPAELKEDADPLWVAVQYFPAAWTVKVVDQEKHPGRKRTSAGRMLMALEPTEEFPSKCQTLVVQLDVP